MNTVLMYICILGLHTEFSNCFSTQRKFGSTSTTICHILQYCKVGECFSTTTRYVFYHLYYPCTIPYNDYNAGSSLQFDDIFEQCSKAVLPGHAMVLALHTISHTTDVEITDEKVTILSMCTMILMYIVLHTMYQKNLVQSFNQSATKFKSTSHSCLYASNIRQFKHQHIFTIMIRISHYIQDDTSGDGWEAVSVEKEQWFTLINQLYTLTLLSLLNNNDTDVISIPSLPKLHSKATSTSLT